MLNGMMSLLYTIGTIVLMVVGRSGMFITLDTYDITFAYRNMSMYALEKRPGVGGSIYIYPTVFFIYAIPAIAHLVYLLDEKYTRLFYRKQMNENVHLYRWVEYVISGTPLVVVIGYCGGLVTPTGLLFYASVFIFLLFYAYTLEVTVYKGEIVFTGWLLVLLSHIALFYRLGKNADGIYTWMTATVEITCVLFFLIGVFKSIVEMHTYEISACKEERVFVFTGFVIRTIVVSMLAANLL